MAASSPTDEAAYDRRFRSTSAALDSPAQVVAMARLIARARDGASGAGLVIVGGERLYASRRVGLLASSMNPLTRAHVALAEAARVSARLDALCWVGTVVTVDKEHVERASLADRLTEARAYAQAAGDGLLLLTGGLYVDQARAARTFLASGVEVALIVGFDKIVQILDPRYYVNRDVALHELFAEAEVIVSPRDGATEDDLRALLARPENLPFADRVRYCPLPARYVGDSSTEARALARAGDYGQALRDLLAPEGMALALAASPYEQARPAGDADLGDTYTARQALLAALGDLTLAELATAPGLERLVGWSAEKSKRGAALRAWARQAELHRLEGLRAALTAS